MSSETENIQLSRDRPAGEREYRPRRLTQCTEDRFQHQFNRKIVDLKLNSRQFMFIELRSLSSCFLLNLSLDIHLGSL